MGQRVTVIKTVYGEHLDAAIDTQIVSDLLFSTVLGLSANLDHFLNPISRTFLDMETAIYLRTSVVHSLPQYTKTQEILSTTELNTDLISYTTYIETIGQKLGHYFGYLLGDELLPRIVPGYQTDPIQAIRYHNLVCRDTGIE